MTFGDDLAVGVVGGGGLAQPHARPIAFIFIAHIVAEARGGAQADYQQAGGQRV